MLESLSQQVLLCVSVVGIRYAFSLADIVARYRELFDATVGLHCGQAEVEESAAYTLRRLGPPRGVRPRRKRGRLRGPAVSLLLTRDDACAKSVANVIRITIVVQHQ